MRAWIMVKALRVDDRVLAVRVDFGEPAYHEYSRTLGAPAARYFEKGGRECAKQWNVRRKANRNVFWALWRVLRAKEEGEVVDVPRVGTRRAA